MMPKPYRRPEWLCDDRGGPGVDPKLVELHRRLCEALVTGKCTAGFSLMFSGTPLAVSARGWVKCGERHPLRPIDWPIQIFFGR